LIYSNIMGQPFLNHTDQSGNQIDPSNAVFPICKLINDELIFLGTGFFISSAGIFVTAKHVLENEKENIYAVTFLPGDQFFMRSITQFTYHNLADVGVGTLNEARDENGDLLRMNQVPLAEYVPGEGELLSCLGYPHSEIKNNPEDKSTIASFNLNTVHGEITEVHINGFGIVKGHVFVADFTNKGGSSGGPVFTPYAKGAVGIASSGNDQGYYFVISAINQIRDLALNNIKLFNEEPRSVTIQELINYKLITVL
jgi:hypothetical protein